MTAVETVPHTPSTYTPFTTSRRVLVRALRVLGRKPQWEIVRFDTRTSVETVISRHWFQDEALWCVAPSTPMENEVISVRRRTRNSAKA